MVDVQSPTAEIRQGKKERRTNDRMKIYMACPITQGGHKKTRQTYTENANQMSVVRAMKACNAEVVDMILEQMCL